jgi:hypothetical protein
VTDGEAAEVADWSAGRGIARLVLALVACCLGLNSLAKATEIKATPIPAIADTALVSVSGALDTTDAERFRAAVAMYPKAIVAFESTGGSLTAGIEIGTQIRLRNYSTWVPSGLLCASVCATAWLEGTKRFMGKGARIGFHER